MDFLTAPTWDSQLTLLSTAKMFVRVITDGDGLKGHVTSSPAETTVMWLEQQQHLD